MKTLSGKVAVVTGAGGGIGAAVARRLSAEGMRLALVDLAIAPVEELARSLGRASAHVADVSQASAWERLAREVQRVHGGVDVLVNNAGVTILGAFDQQSIADLDRIVDVNLKGVLYGCRTFLPLLAARGEAHVVNVASLAGRVPFPYQSTYCATKYAVRGFTASLRMELAGRGIGVSAVLPGAVATRLLETARSYDAPASSKLAELMLAHGMPPERVADRVVDAIEGDLAEVLVGWDARVATFARAVAPRALEAALGSAFRWRAGRRS
ncbi:MAG: hypothetical protein OHK0013_40850 [Sandaracinaceae bacterium]